MKTLFIDIETAPAKAYIWDLRTRYVPISQVAEDGYILCFSYCWEDGSDIICYTEWKDGHEKMIQKAWELLDEADCVVHYNGNKFDIPRLNTEFLRLRMGPPSPAFHVDLYQTVCNKFKVLSKSMNHMLQILDLDTKLDHKGIALWTGCMAGNREDRNIMVDYNIQDVEVMVDLYHQLMPWIHNMPNAALWLPPGEDRMCRCGSTNLRFKGYKRTKVLTYKQYHCQDCGAYMRERYAENSGKNRRKDVLTW